MSRDLAVAWKPITASRSIASVRLRTYAPIEYLKEDGWNAELFHAGRADAYDVVVFQKAYSSEDVELAETLRRRASRVVLDLCDNHFYNPDRLPHLDERAKRLEEMVQLADVVTVSTPALAEVVPHAEVVLVDDALDFNRPLAPVRPEAVSYTRRHPLRLAWFGNVGLKSPPFGVVDLPLLFPHLDALRAEVPVELIAITGDRKAAISATRDSPVPVVFRKWRGRRFSPLLRTADVCVLPANLNPFTRCKSANRVATALMNGLPVVASRVPSYVEFEPFIRIDDWVRHLTDYAFSPGLAHAHVVEGQKYTAARFSRTQILSAWTTALLRALNSQN